MRIRIVAIAFFFACGLPIFGQGRAAAFSDAFNQLGSSTIYNVVLVSEPANPGAVILNSKVGGFGLTLFSLAGQRSKVRWKLDKIPDYMSVIDPSKLRVVIGDQGPVILLHGCARHLCGGQGLAGALAYVMKADRMCSAYASWSSTTKTTSIVYEPPVSDDTCKWQVGLLNSMLRDEGYTP
jgi:hypothetical protein